MLLTQKQLDEFHIRGFIKAGRVLDDAAVDRLLEEMHAVMDNRSEKKAVLNRNMLAGRNEYGEGKSNGRVVQQIVNIWEASSAFLEHARHPEITETVARLCNNTDTLRIWHDQIQYKPPQKGGPTNWHQDHPAWPVIVPADLISAWVALEDAEIDNGCMWMVPGSHRWGRIRLQSGSNFEPVYDQDLLPEGAVVKAEPLPVKKGEVAFHHCMTWHGSPPNNSDRPRPAIAVHYMPGYTIYKPAGGHPMEKHIDVAPGEVLAGEHFPVVYERVLAEAFS